MSLICAATVTTLGCGITGEVGEKHCIKQTDRLAQGADERACAGMASLGKR